MHNLPRAVAYGTACNRRGRRGDDVMAAGVVPMSCNKWLCLVGCSFAVTGTGTTIRIEAKHVFPMGVVPDPTTVSMPFLSQNIVSYRLLDRYQSWEKAWLLFRLRLVWFCHPCRLLLV